MPVNVNYELNLYSCNHCGIVYGYPKSISQQARCPKCLVNEKNATRK